MGKIHVSCMFGSEVEEIPDLTIYNPLTWDVTLVVVL